MSERWKFVLLPQGLPKRTLRSMVIPQGPGTEILREFGAAVEHRPLRSELSYRLGRSRVGYQHEPL